MKNAEPALDAHDAPFYFVAMRAAKRSRLAIAGALASLAAAVLLAVACHDDCKNGYGFCGGGCVDNTTDLDNCGECGRYCVLGETCFRGNCVVPGALDLDAGPDATIEIDAGPDGGALDPAEVACAVCLRPLLSSGKCASTFQTCKATPSCDDWSLKAEACFPGFEPACFEDAVSRYHEDKQVLATILCACDACRTVCPPLCSQ